MTDRKAVREVLSKLLLQVTIRSVLSTALLFDVAFSGFNGMCFRMSSLQIGDLEALIGGFQGDNAELHAKL